MKYRLLSTPFVTPVLRAICLIVLKVFGWTIEGEIPAHMKKYVATVAPHTSNWDFPIMLMAAFVLRVDAHWLGKHTLFKFPFGGVMRYLGGIPIDRSVRSDSVSKIAKMFDVNDKFAVGIAPEGTRSITKRWRTGFWHIAHGAKVPVLLAFLNYKTKRAGVLGELKMSDDVYSDMKRIQLIYEVHLG